MKYFLKAPWQSKRQEVTAEQYVKAKLNFAKFRHLQAPSFVPIPFISTHGVEGWVEEDEEDGDCTITRYTCPVCNSRFYLKEHS